MTTTIWKYPLAITTEQWVQIPRGAEILSAQLQHGTLCVWTRVDVNAEKVNRVIWVHGTGHEIEATKEPKFIDTFQMDGGSLIFHVFDGGEIG